MSQQRIEALLAMTEAQPEEAMIWYGLANEYSKLERWREAADALQRVVRINPDFTSAYQMLGTAHMNLGDRDAARNAWNEGIIVAGHTGAWKARQHMEGLLAGSGDSEVKGGGLCQESD